MSIETSAINISRWMSEWSHIAGEAIEVEPIKGVVYGFGSELGVLRLFAEYNCRGNSPVKNVRVGFSENLGKWFFSLERKF